MRDTDERGPEIDQKHQSKAPVGIGKEGTSALEGWAC